MILRYQAKKKLYPIFRNVLCFSPSLILGLACLHTQLDVQAMLGLSLPALYACDIELGSNTVHSQAELADKPYTTHRIAWHIEIIHCV